MQTILTVVHLFLAIGLVGLILMQHGKGADAGAAFGSGASGTVFGARGAANFLSRTTAVLAILFFVTSVALGWFAMEQKGTKIDMMQGVDGQVVVPVEAVKPKVLATDADIPQVAVGSESAGNDVPVVPAPEQVKTSVPEVPAPVVETPAVEPTVVPEALPKAEEAAKAVAVKPDSVQTSNPAEPAPVESPVDPGNKSQ